MWVPFNEGWGQPDAAGTRAMAEWTARYDPTRLVNNTSGWTDAGAGHTTDVHQYPGPSMPALERDRAAVLGEFGGLGLPTRGHTWQDEKNWGYVSFKDTAEYERAYREKIAQLRLLVARGLSAAVYTQTTDVEIETNGLMTYDREVFKISPLALARHPQDALRPAPGRHDRAADLGARGPDLALHDDGSGRRGRGRSRGSTTARGRPARRRSAAASPRACRCARRGRRRASGRGSASTGPAGRPITSIW